MKYSCAKDIDCLVRQHVDGGWTYRRGRKHGTLSPPAGGPRVTVPGTPSDWRALRNFERDLRRAYRGERSR
jgi:hypothetical protein